MNLSELIASDNRYDVDLELEDGDIVTDVVTLVRVQRLTDTDDARCGTAYVVPSLARACEVRCAGLGLRVAA